MPPKIKVTEDEILQAAIDFIRVNGMESLNARDLSKELSCSVHPIFRVFDSMDGLKNAVYKEAESIYNQSMVKAMQQSDNGFLNMGLAYIEFAKNEKNLFRLIFMSDAFREQSMLDIVGSTQGDDQVIELICQNTSLSPQGAKELYAGIWLTTHGIASMFATNSCKFSDDEIRRLLNNSFMGLVMKLKKEEVEAK